MRKEDYALLQISHRSNFLSNARFWILNGMSINIQWRMVCIPRNHYYQSMIHRECQIVEPPKQQVT